ncbi:MAG: lactate permease LctP family transporter [Acidobacteriota bacterium]
MWLQTYDPVGSSLGWSAAVAALPLLVLVYLLGFRRRPAWRAAISALVAAWLLAVLVYRMPWSTALSAAAYGAAFGLFPITWIVFSAILLYQLTVRCGRFEELRAGLGRLTADRALQALLIAFAFGAFLEGAAGFGTPVAVAAGMLAGLGFDPFFAAAVCLLANTAPVAFGSIGIPVVTLAGVTGLDELELSAAVGKICAPVSLIIPGYLVWVMGGLSLLRTVLPAALACGLAFATAQFLVSNFIGPQLTDIVSSLSAIGTLIFVIRFSPGRSLRAEDSGSWTPARGTDFLAPWAPYLFLVALVLLWGVGPVREVLSRVTITFPWPGLDGAVGRVPPVVSEVEVYPAVFRFDWLAAAGTACFLASVASLALPGVAWRHFREAFVITGRQMALPTLTIACVLGLAFLMNYSGAAATLGLALTSTGPLFPFFSPILGWLGVFLTGSDTAANALFGNLQVVTAQHLALPPNLTAAANSAGGVLGKMISLQSIAVAVAATGLPRSDESRLFRFTLRHSIFLAGAMGLLVTVYAYLAPDWF